MSLGLPWVGEQLQGLKLLFVGGELTKLSELAQGPGLKLNRLVDQHVKTVGQLGGGQRLHCDRLVIDGQRQHRNRGEDVVITLAIVVAVGVVIGEVVGILDRQDRTVLAGLVLAEINRSRCPEGWLGPQIGFGL